MTLLSTFFIGLAIISYLIIGVLFTILVNKNKLFHVSLFGEEGVFFWPIFIILYIVHIGSLLLKKLFIKLKIPTEIDSDI
jgi:hypothetical protein